MIVQSGLDGVTITRGRGLTVSMPLHEPNHIDQANAPVEPVIRRDWWQDAQRGSARERSFQPSSSMIESGEAYSKPSLWLQPAP